MESTNEFQDRAFYNLPVVLGFFLLQYVLQMALYVVSLGVSILPHSSVVGNNRGFGTLSHFVLRSLGKRTLGGTL